MQLLLKQDSEARQFSYAIALAQINVGFRLGLNSTKTGTEQQSWKIGPKNLDLLV